MKTVWLTFYNLELPPYCSGWYTAGLITKERLEKEFRETADLQLFSNVKTDDDGNYINPLDGNIPDDDEEIEIDITPPEKSDTEYLC